MVKFRTIFINAWLLFVVVLWGGCCNSQILPVEVCVSPILPETEIVFDSIIPDFNFYPERWDIIGDTLWTINSRDSLFLHGYDLKRGESICYWGKRGEGPDDFLFPGIIEGGIGGRLGLYSNTGNKVVSYDVVDGMPLRFERGKMPVMSNRDIPKPYTRLASVNDSIVLGTYFMPREASAELFNAKSGKLYNKIKSAIVQPDEHMSGPYEFKVAVSSNKIISAYRYIDCIEFYRITPDFKAELVCMTGDTKNQNDLYEADRDDEMIKYYSDVQCDSTHVYVLFHGVEIKDLEISPTYLRVYDLTSHENVANIKFDRYFNQLLIVGGGTIVLASPVYEDNIYTVKLDL